MKNKKALFERFKAMQKPLGKNNDSLEFLKFKNKKAELTMTTVIWFIVGAIILAILVYVISTGGVDSLKRIFGFSGGKINVADVVQSCNVACATSSEFDYCTRARKVVFDTNKNGTRELTCKNLEFQKVGLTCDNLDCANLYGSCANWGGSPSLASDCSSSSQGILLLEEETDEGLVCCIPKKTCTEFGGVESEPGNICSTQMKWVSEATLAKVVSNWDALVKANKKCCIQAS